MLKDYAGKNLPAFKYRFIFCEGYLSMGGKIGLMKNITKILKNMHDRSVRDFITPGMVSYEYQS